MNPQPSKDHSGSASARLLMFVVIFGILPALLIADAPSWWTSRGVLVPSGTANDYAAVNQGQLKNIAVAAVAEMNANLSQFGGSGTTLNNLSTALSATNANTNDYAAVNLGQLKNLAQPFYDRLIAIGYTDQYPWLSSTNAANDYAMANIGQVKNLFSFDLTSGTSQNGGVPNWWETYYFGGTDSWMSGTMIAPSGALDSSGSMMTIAEAYSLGVSPVDYYNGVSPTLTIISGTNQTGAPGAMLSAPLVVQVTGTSGQPMVNAPVWFTVNVGAGLLAPDNSGTSALSDSLLALTGTNGYAQVYFQQPFDASFTSTIGAYAENSEVDFSEITLSDTNAPAAPSNVSAVVQPDGSVAISWQDNSNNETGFTIQQSNDGGATWSTVGTVGADITTFTLAANSNVTSGVTQFQVTAGGSAGNTSSTNNATAFQPIPTITYAAIDMSEVLSLSGNAVTQVALDDNNNAAFAFLDSTGSNCITYTWKNGTATYVQTFPLTVVSFDPAFPTINDLTPNAVDTSGHAFGAYSQTNIWDDDLPKGSFESDTGSPYQLSPDNIIQDTEFTVPIPWFEVPDIVGYVPDDIYFPYTKSSPTDVSPNGGYCGKEDFYGGGIVVTSSTAVFFDPSLYSNDGSSLGNGTQVINENFYPVAMNNSGWACGYYGIESVNDGNAGIWTGDRAVISLAPMNLATAINSAGQVVGVGTTPGTAYFWTSSSAVVTGTLVTPGQVQTISSLIPDSYRNEVTFITPIAISGTDPDNLAILFNATYQTDSNGGTGWSSFLLTVASGSSTLQQVSLPSSVNMEMVPRVTTYGSTGNQTTMNVNGLIAGLGTITGTDGTTSAQKALLLVPVVYTGTDSPPPSYVDDGLVSGFASGFDGYSNPPWLMVPENLSNSAIAYTKASTSLTTTFTGTTQDTSMWMTVTPTTTNTSPQTITVNAGSTNGDYSSEIAVGVPGCVGIGGELHVDVKQYQLITVEISVITQKSRNNPAIVPTNAPTAAALQTYLNQVYGPQTNTYFYVQRHDYTLNFDPTGNVNNPGADGLSKVNKIRRTATNSTFDFNLYYVPSVTGPEDSTGWSFPDAHDAIIGSNSGSDTPKISAHELGHLFGLKHPEDPGPQHDPWAPEYNLMHHYIEGTFLDHLQWDIVNPYDPRKL